MDNQETLAYWITERCAVQDNKDRDYPKPWSDDRVFQTVYFCNVQREDDKVTRWIRENYTPEFFGKNYELAICASRIFNRPETLERISNCFVNGYNEDMLWCELQAMKKFDKQIWSGAYVITTHGQKMSKIDYCVQTLKAVSEGIHKGPAIASCQQAFLKIQEFDGFGSFLAAQVVADLKNTKGHVLENAPDWHVFSAPGPGSLRGMGWFFDTMPDRPYRRTYYQAGMGKIRRYLMETTAAGIVGQICNQDLQNCLCEYDKYLRVKTGAGRSKRKYAGTGA